MNPFVSRDDDGTLNVEWIAKDLRFGISYDSDERKWFWWYASPTHYDHGFLPDELIQAIIDNYYKGRSDASPYFDYGLFRH